jgi:hypothetical protein
LGDASSFLTTTVDYNIKTMPNTSESNFFLSPDCLPLKKSPADLLECTADDELKRYIESPLEDSEIESAVAWWRVSENYFTTAESHLLQHHSTQFPIHSKAAEDNLAIQRSATKPAPSECVLSSGTTQCE